MDKRKIDLLRSRVRDVVEYLGKRIPCCEGVESGGMQIEWDQTHVWEDQDLELSVHSVGQHGTGSVQGQFFDEWSIGVVYKGSTVLSVSGSNDKIDDLPSFVYQRDQWEKKLAVLAKQAAPIKQAREKEWLERRKS